MLEATARQLTICPSCNNKKEQGLVVCWKCWRYAPGVEGGFKTFDGTLEQFISKTRREGE